MRLIDFVAGLSPTFTPNSAPGRALNTDFTPSNSRPTLVIYTVRISGANTANQTTGRVELRSDTLATPTTVRCQVRQDFKVTGALTTMNGSQDAVLVYLVPIGHNVRLGSVSEAGVPTFSITSQTEIVL